MADVNAHNIEWFSKETDEEGERVADTLWDLNLDIVNQPSEHQTFENRRGHKTNIDITAISPALTEQNITWEIIQDEVPSSDHNPIMVVVPPQLHIKKQRSEYYYSTDNVNWNALRSQLEQTKPTLDLLTVEQEAVQIIKWLQRACDKTI